MIEILHNLSQGWTLTLLSSCLCIVGTLIILIDDIYYTCLPKFITSKFKIQIKQNYRFLNGSLAFSSGCLIFTSLYRLLPSAHEYLANSNNNNNNNHSGHTHNLDEDGEGADDNHQWNQFILILSYIMGILICLSFNYILHLLTSESVVHCNHGGDVTTDLHDINGDLENQIGVHHHHHHGDTLFNDNYNGSDGRGDHNKNSNSMTETTPLIDNTKNGVASVPVATARKRKSIIQLILKHDDIEDGSGGECKGYSSAELCTFHNNNNNNNNKILTKLNGDGNECDSNISEELDGGHPGDEEEGEGVVVQQTQQLHYCEIPTLSQELIENNNNNNVNAYSYPPENDIDHFPNTINDFDGNDANNNNNNNIDMGPLYSIHSKSSHSLHSHAHSHARSHRSHKIDHHHVNSPLSRLLTIGIQTTLAITLHKLPEGFITYITSETNPQLGISIFISLLIHNFTEGFSMCLPLYYSMNNSTKYPKLKAIIISSTLGGLSQPLGAILGYFFLLFNSHNKNSDNNYDVDKLNRIFGITMAITSGFLTVISLSMYGSSVSFGGNINFVMTWCIIGISVIGITSVLT